jgi:hypothetical protein
LCLVGCTPKRKLEIMNMPSSWKLDIVTRGKWNPFKLSLFSLHQMVVSLARSPNSTTSNPKQYIGSIVEEIKEEEIMKQQHDDVEMMGMDREFQAISDYQEEANSQHAFF